MHTGWLDGTTAVVVAVARSFLLVANVGDSRAILCDESGAVTPLSSDHKPSRRDELQRIEDLGGFVLHLGVPRVNGILAVSRAIGDAELKHLVPSEPEIRCIGRKNTQQFVALASDGVWDVMTNEEVAAVIRREWNKEGKGARQVAMEAYIRGSFDNICCMVVDLTATKEKRERERKGDKEGEKEGEGEGGFLPDVLAGVYDSSDSKGDENWGESTTSLRDVSGDEEQYDAPTLRGERDIDNVPGPHSDEEEGQDVQSSSDISDDRE